MEQLATVNIKGKEYVEVKTRVQWFRKNIENGCIKTDHVFFDGETIMCQTEILVDGKLVATGMAHEEKNASAINKTSFVEICETSSVGRALGMYGIGIESSVDTAGTIRAAIALQESMDRQDELMQYKSESLTGKLMIAIESDDEEGIAEVEKDYRGNVPLASRVKLGLTPEHLEYMEERKERLLVERQAKAKAKHERNVEAASKLAQKNSEV
jgi:hypothetical protein